MCTGDELRLGPRGPAGDRRGSGHAYLWDAEKGKIAHCWQLGEKVLHDIAFRDDNVFAVSSGPEVFTLDLRTPVAPVKMKEVRGVQKRGPSKIAWSPDGSTLALAALGGGVGFLDEQGTVAHGPPLLSHEAPVVGISWQSSRALVCALESGHVFVAAPPASGSPAACRYEFVPGLPEDRCTALAVSAPLNASGSGGQFFAIGVHSARGGEVVACPAPSA